MLTSGFDGLMRWSRTVASSRETRCSCAVGSMSLVVEPSLGLECDLRHSVAVTGGSGPLFQDGVRRSRPLAPANTRLPQSLESRPVAVVFGHGYLAVRIVPDTAEWLIAISHMPDTLRLIDLPPRSRRCAPRYCVATLAAAGAMLGEPLLAHPAKVDLARAAPPPDVYSSMASPPSVRHTAISHIGGTPLLARLCPGDARVCSVVHISDHRAIDPVQASTVQEGLRVEGARSLGSHGVIVTPGTAVRKSTPPPVHSCTATGAAAAAEWRRWRPAPAVSFRGLHTMDIADWQRKAQAVIDVGRVPPFSFQGRGRMLGRIAAGPASSFSACSRPTTR